jgi:hypothetical protein
MYCAQGGGEVSHTEQEELDTAMDRKQQLKTRTGLQQKLEQIGMAMYGIGLSNVHVGGYGIGMFR